MNPRSDQIKETPVHPHGPYSPCPERESAVNNKKLAALHEASYNDNKAYMAGKITHEQYWDRVHARDRQVAAMSTQERAQVNTCGKGHCSCSFCRTHSF
jgi:hypothetical protein